MPLDDLAHGTGERDELFQTLRDARNARLVEHKAILELRAARTGGDLLGVDGDDLSRVRDERVGSKRKHLVLIRIGRKGDRRGMLFCHAAGLGNGHNTLLMRAARRADQRGGRRHIENYYQYSKKKRRCQHAPLTFSGAPSDLKYARSGARHKRGVVLDEHHCGRRSDDGIFDHFTRGDIQIVKRFIP